MHKNREGNFFWKKKRQLLLWQVFFFAAYGLCSTIILVMLSLVGVHAKTLHGAMSFSRSNLHLNSFCMCVCFIFEVLSLVIVALIIKCYI